VFVAQASSAFSANWLEADPTAWAAALRVGLEERWELSQVDRLATFTHRWRFARCVQSPSGLDDLPSGFFVTGDVRTKSRVESAWIAGRETAERVFAGIQCQWPRR
jgi:predicted NAD/FAD-dependent oxidoreductase